ncbi:pecanex-like protein 4 [Ylistrum balloti]|uniref:pecanex-like protein 4 n=1 Tax=Ylistrum balloti TaxID=509963 RepID=UPI002905BC8A|nr:pecanex-like protein 4 [Ylistrum balloti]
MGTGIPLLNEYKRDFFYKRLPQTILGGPKLKLGYEAPVYVYLNQVLLFIIPFLIGGVFTLLVELGTVTDYIAVIVYGCLIFTFVLITQIISTAVQLQNSSDLTLPIKKKNLLAEDDEVDFFSCCGVETFEFVAPKKKFMVNIVLHSVVGGSMCGLALWYLLPTTLGDLYSYNTGVTVILYTFGWITLCVAQYPLTITAPPEPATFRTLDSWELSPLMRPFYVFLCITFHLLYRFLSTVFLSTDQTLHVLFSFLPLLWMLGILPPLDAVFYWLFEQLHVHLLGGSTSASGVRLVVLLTLSLGVYLGAYFISASLGSVLLAALCGYLLSTDLGSLGDQLHTFIHTRNKVASGSQDTINSNHRCQFLWKWRPLEFLYHFIMLAIVGVLAGLVNYNLTNDDSIWRILGYVIIGLCVVEKILRDIQSVYIILGLWRNMLFPPTATRTNLFKDRKRKLKPLGVLRRVIVNWVAPLIMLAYCSLLVTTTDPTTKSLRSDISTYTSVWYIFGVVRVFRWVWQSTPNSLLELSITHLILVTLSTNSTVAEFGLPILSLIIGLCRDRFFQFLNKLYFCVSLLISSWTDKKQRRGSTAVIIFLSIILFPVVLGIILVATALSAPLLPLFTLPIFFITFPRPSKFWPEAVGASANVCADSMFYRQFAPKFAEVLRTAFADGSLGEPVPGNHYLVRFQDRLAWVQVLERGCGYCTVNIKGLELQETSCHTAEAARLDDIFEEAFEREQGFALGSMNQYPLHTLTPVDAAYVHTYSDARNVLTGIIDSPGSYQTTMTAFSKSLVWVLLHHINRTKCSTTSPFVDRDSDSGCDSSEGKEKMEMEEINHNQETMNNNLSPPSASRRVVGASSMTGVKTVDTVVMVNKPPVVKRQSSWASIESFADSLWSDDGIFDNKTNKNTFQKSKVSTYPSVDNSKSKNKLSGDKDDLDDLFEELDFGLPASDITKPKQVMQPTFTAMKSKAGAIGNNTIYKPVTNLAGSPDFKCPHSFHISVPARWRELPVEYSQLSRYLDQFPREWYRFVLGTLDWSVTGQPREKVAIDVGQDDTLMNCYAQLVMACYSIFDAQASFSSASTLYKYYTGDLPWNAMLDWLSEDKELHSLVIKCFRYGFKLMLDQMLLGEATSSEELQEYMEEYDRDWYIGLESDDQWKTAVLASKPNLFSLGHNNQQGTYTSRVLSLQEVAAHIGRLNTEVVRGQWANLSLELLYFTNDDEERYSIQAHPTVLRNLTVQSADPPLGYPIFSSPPISIPTI